MCPTPETTRNRTNTLLSLVVIFTQSIQLSKIVEHHVNVASGILGYQKGFENTVECAKQLGRSGLSLKRTDKEKVWFRLMQLHRSGSAWYSATSPSLNLIVKSRLSAFAERN